jgi:NADH-quinone oxidoreductase subunit H
MMLDFLSLLDFFRDNLPSPIDRLAYLIAAMTLAFLVINAMVMTTAVYTWFERRTLGRFQSRLGPNRWGPFGLFQPLADVLKLISKEDVIPDVADKPAFTVAPLLLLVPMFLVFAVIPFGGDSFLGRLNVGVLFIVAVTGFSTLAIFTAGWASRNKYAMFGAMRAVAMLISYEVPMALALTGVVVLAGSMSLLGIVGAQSVPYILVQPLGFFVFMTAASAEMSRAPFDMIEAESELGGGYITEYAGIKFGIMQLAEFMAPIATAAVATVLFLGGTRGFDPIPGQIWFVAKAFALVFFLLWIRATWPRLRVDQIMGFAWKGLLPLALVNMFVVAIEFAFLQDSDTGAITRGDLWAMAAVNWVIAVVAIVITANVLGQRRLRPETPVPSPLANMAAEAD